MDFSFSREQLMFKKEVINFAKKEIAPRTKEHDLKSEFDLESFWKMADFGILGLHFPEEYGGSGADVVTTALVGEALAEGGADSGFLLAYGAHTFLCGDTLFRNASQAQKKKYIPKIISGEWVGCMGVTEPDAGSDMASMKTTAEKRGDKYILNGSKMFITNGPIADVAVVYAKTDPNAKHAGVSAFIVERGTPGFTSGPPLKKMGVRTSLTSELIFSNCEIPAENLLGKEGDGFKMASQTVEWDRSVLLAPTVGSVTYLLNKCARYAKDRNQFGRPIAEYQAIKRKLAELKIFGEAARSLVYRIAWAKDQGQPLNHLYASVAKLFIGDWNMAPMNDAVTLHGGYGYCQEYDVERVFRDGRLAAIGGGTSDIQRMIISRMI